MTYKPKVLGISDGGTNAVSFTQSNGIVTYNGTNLVNYAGPQLSAGGVFTNTSQPAFSAYLNTTTTNDKTGDGTIFTIISDIVQFDNGSNYNNSTGVFTAPVAGIYFFGGAITAANNVSGPFDNIVDLNCSTAGVRRVSRTLYPVGENNPQIPIAVIIKLVANETVTLRFTGNGGAKIEGVLGFSSGSFIQTFFCGYLVC